MQQVVPWGLKQAGPKKLKHRMCMHTHTSKDSVSHSSSLAQINHVVTSAHLYSQLSHSSSPATRVNKLLQRFAARDLHLERMWRHNCSFCSTNIPPFDVFSVRQLSDIAQDLPKDGTFAQTHSHHKYNFSGLFQYGHCCDIYTTTLKYWDCPLLLLIPSSSLLKFWPLWD